MVRFFSFGVRKIRWRPNWSEKEFYFSFVVGDGRAYM